MAIKTILWQNNCIKLIDQTKLPGKLTYIYCRDVKTLWEAIKRLSVRGAPAIGVAAAFGVLLGSQKIKTNDAKKFVSEVSKICDYIGTSRPTAVNLFYALERMKKVLHLSKDATVKKLKVDLYQEAMAMFKEDQQVCRQMGKHGATLIKSGDTIMTICNAGALATVDYGTALGVMCSAKAQGKNFKVFACETRPLLQGARLTAWELTNEKIHTTLICDNMAATVMKQKNIKGIFVGADRIAANGDTANKIGTYNLAVLAKYHHVPFYVVAPRSTFDLNTKTGKDIPIEERDKSEVMGFRDIKTAPAKVNVFNPAFDVTDNSLITAIVTEYGIIRPPFTKNIKATFK